MRKFLLSAMTLMLTGLNVAPIYAQTSASNYLVAQPLSSNVVAFDLTDPGISKTVEFGADLAWADEYNFRRALLFMGKDQVDVARVSYQPSYPLVNGDLQQPQIDALNWRLGVVQSYANPGTGIVMNVDAGDVDTTIYYKNAENWTSLVKATATRIQDAGFPVVSVGPMNEPDYSTHQGDIDDFFSIAVAMRNDPFFDNIRVSGGNTLNDDVAAYWYNYLVPAGVDEGNTHQLAGSFDNFANFFQTVRANGHHASDDELHNVVEGLVGYEYGMQTGIWWGPAEYARGEMVKAFDGQRIGYDEHRQNWTAAAVYRTPEGKVQAFAGTSERQAATTTYDFISKDRVVYFDGHGPMRNFALEMPGGTGYWNGQTNAERVINITWGDDIQPAIDGRYILVNRMSGLVIEIADGSMENGADVQQGAYTGAPSQQWDVKPVDSRVGGDFSYYSITSASNGKAIDDYNWTLENGGNIAMWDNYVSANQQRYLEYVEDGWFYIRSRHSSKVLTVDGAPGVDQRSDNSDGNAFANGIHKKSGTSIIQWDPMGLPEQQWRLLPIDAPIEFDAPSAPGGLVATAQPASVKLEWTASPEADVAGYSVFRAESAGGPYNTIARNVTTSSFVDNTAFTGITYFYAVKVEDHSLNRSAYSNESSGASTGTNDMVASLQFEGNTSDNTVNLNHGATYGSITYGPGKVGDQAINLNGSDAFIQLPADIASHQEITIAAWVYYNGGNPWQRLFDFGNGRDEYMFLTPRNYWGDMQFSIKYNGVEQSLGAPTIPSRIWTHLAVTLGTNGAKLYVDGNLVAENTDITISPLDFKPVRNYIGRSQWPDPLLNASIDDFKVFNYALTDGEISDLVGEIVPEPISGHIYTIANKFSGKVLDIDGANPENGGLLVQYENFNSDNQKWLLTQLADGYWTLEPQHAPGKVLDIPYSNFSEGVQPQIYDLGYYDGQKFNLIDKGDGYYQIAVKDNSTCLNDWGWSRDDLAPIRLWYTWSNDINQLWRFYDTGSESKSATIPAEGINALVEISAYPNPVQSKMSIDIRNYTGDVRVEIYGMDGRLQKQVVNGIFHSGTITISRWGYTGLALVKVTAGQEVKILKVNF